MLNSMDLRLAYNEFYASMRNYIWDFQVVCNLADIETAVYMAFPDMGDIYVKLRQIYPMISETMKDDKELEDSYNDFLELSSTTDELYNKIMDISM